MFCDTDKPKVSFLSHELHEPMHIPSATSVPVIYFFLHNTTKYKTYVQ